MSKCSVVPWIEFWNRKRTLMGKSGEGQIKSRVRLVVMMCQCQFLHFDKYNKYINYIW